MAHFPEGSRPGIRQLADTWKQHPFLFEQMDNEEVLQLVEQCLDLAQFWMRVGVRVFNLLNQARDPRELPSKLRVVDDFDMVAQVAKRGAEPVSS